MISGIKFERNKCQIVHLEQSNNRHKSKLGEELLERSPAKRDLGVLVSSKLKRSQHCALVHKRAKHTLEGIKHSKNSQSKDVIFIKVST